MNLRLPQNSLFAILLRSKWWVSAMVAVGVFGVARLLLPAGYAAFAALPFAVIALYVAGQALRAPGERRLAAALERHRAMSWDGFVASLEEAFRREGYTVRRARGAQVDLELERAGKTTLVACKRWKATRTGVEPLREFHAAASRREADERIYVAAGEVSDKARTFAAEHRVRLIEQGELARLLLKVR